MYAIFKEASEERSSTMDSRRHCSRGEFVVPMNSNSININSININSINISMYTPRQTQSLVNPQVTANLVRHSARYEDCGLGLAGTRLARGSARACHSVPIPITHHEFLDIKPVQGARIAFATNDFVAWSVWVQR